MKTRNIIAILAALPIVAGMTGCKSDEELTAKPAKEILLVEEGRSIELRSGDEEKAVTVTANCAWTMNVIPDLNNPWPSLTVQPQRGTGNGTLVILSDQNTSIFDRLDTIMLTSDGGLHQKIAIRQKSGDPTINISSKTISFPANPAGAHLMSITSNDNWNIQTPAGINWLHLDKTTGSTGATTINVTADRVTSDAARSTSFTVLYGSSSAEVQVIQAGMNSDDIYLYVPIDQTGFEAKGGEQMIRVESNATWRAFIPSSAQSWMHLENASGAGNGEIRVWCEPNTDSSRERLSLIIIVAGSQNPKQADILVQQGAYNDDHHEYRPDEQWVVNVSDISSMWVGQQEAELRFRFQSNREVVDYGVVYSTTQSMPTRQNAEVLTVGHGGTGDEPIVMLEGLQPGTTYYVRAYVLTSQSDGVFYYSPNVLSFTTGPIHQEPNEDDNPSPQLSPRR